MFVVIVVQFGVFLLVDGVDFVDEDDVWVVLFGLFEQVFDMGCVDVDEYFDEVGVGDGEEWYFGFVGYCMSQ